MALWAKKKYLKLAKGFHGRLKSCANLAISKVERSFQHAYRNRRLRQRNFRREWIQSLSGGLHEHNLPYSRAINLLNHSNLQLDRKILSQLARE
jgi:large subunit ribosomal protein L20